VPSLLITTSRRPSNRVRSFVRDLMTVLPDSERFNRGGMSFDELTARIRQSGARAALIVGTSRGNPKQIQFVFPAGHSALSILIESAVLRREVLRSGGPRISGLHGITVNSSPTDNARDVAGMVADLLEMPLHEFQKVDPVGEGGLNRAIIRFQDVAGDKLIWTHYHAYDGTEIGPRMRIFSVRRSPNHES